MVQLVGKEVGTVGYGLMGFTWRPNPPSQDQAFEAMRTALSLGAVAWNGGEFYGPPERNSLHLLKEYFSKYPSDADKVVLSMKGGAVPGGIIPDSSAANVKRSINECLKLLDGKKFLDLFECARQDGKTPIEETIGAIAEYVKAGKVGGISLSEVNAITIRKAHAVHPISAVEIEFSLFATDVLTNGVMEACAELGITVVAYSPLGRGLLSGQFKKPGDIPDGSFLNHFPRFQGEMFYENMKLVKAVEDLAANKGLSAGQVAIGYILAHTGKKAMPQIIPIPGATTAERVRENMNPAQLNEEDMAALFEILKKFPVHGDRYHAEGMKFVGN